MSDGGTPVHDEPLVTIRSFASPQEASVAQGFLANHEIPSYVQGGQIATTLFYVGTALGGVNLQVPESLAAQASKPLAEEFDSPSEIPGWRCPQCDADVDPGFELCWQCGAEYESVGSPEKQPAPPTETGEELSESHGMPPATPESADAIVDRAWKAAFYGTAFPPLHLYALYLVMQTMGKEVGPSHRKRFYAALLYSAAWVMLWWLFFTEFLR